MGCRKFISMTFITTALMLFMTSGVFAVETTCTFNEETQRLEYSVSDGEAGVEYIIHVTPSDISCLSVDGTPPTITGPSGSADVGLICSGPGGALVNVQICKEALCFSTYNYRFICTDDCSIRFVKDLDQVPALTIWGGAALVMILLAGAWYFLRYRKLATN